MMLAENPRVTAGGGGVVGCGGSDGRQKYPGPPAYADIRVLFSLVFTPYFMRDAVIVLDVRVVSRKNQAPHP
jgi:hypothetical protein